MIFSQKKSTVIFVVDPMCSWCWGFSPVIKTLLETRDEQYDFSLVLGGLRTKGEMIWDQGSKAYLKEHWQQVKQKTGQIFADILFEKEHFEYDTYPACKAVVTVRELFGIEHAFGYLHLIQEAFYVRGVDVTQEENLTALVEKMQLDVQAFETFFQSDRGSRLTEHDFAKARSMGANAFPSVVIIDNDGHLTCQKGYRNIVQMKQLLGENNA